MKKKNFFQRLASHYLASHLIAMAVPIIILCIGVKVGLDVYTHHGENIVVPDLKGMSYEKAFALLDKDGLNIVISDSGYNKALAANAILIQNPGAGTTVKMGHTVYVTVNSPSSPSFAIPDIVDNSSYREAEAKLMALGFKLLPPQEVAGEKDWVYGVLCRGRRVSAGDRVSIDNPLTLMIGSGEYDSDEEIDYIEPEYRLMESGNVDEFEEELD
jgi:hypothetical protein